MSGAHTDEMVGVTIVPAEGIPPDVGVMASLHWSCVYFQGRFVCDSSCNRGIELGGQSHHYPGTILVELSRTAS